MTIQIRRNFDYSNRAIECRGDDYPCVVCGRGCPEPEYMVRVDIFHKAYLPSEPINDDDDLGMYPLGSECLKKHPELMPYAVKQKVKVKKIKASDWKALYFDLYRQTCGDELASDEECMKDAGKRLEILKVYRESEIK